MDGWGGENEKKIFFTKNKLLEHEEQGKCERQYNLRC